MSTPKKTDTRLLTLRSAVVLLFAVIIGAIAGGLTFLTTKSAPAAVLVGGGAFGSSALWLDKLIAT